MLEELCNLNGVSGNEGAVAGFLKARLSGFCEMTQDNMGNLICHKKSRRENAKRVLVCAHMDEVGLIISQITDEGFLKFKPVGGIDALVLYSKGVTINGRKGVICGRAVHLQEKDERKKVIEAKNLYIDIGAGSKEEAQAAVEIGDYAAFDTRYREMEGHQVVAKALDDRVGCAVLARLLQQDFDLDFYGVFTVQEETGLRGAKALCSAPALCGVPALSEDICPDLALVLEGTTCNDVYGAADHEKVTTLGGGAAVTMMDRGMFANRDLVRRIMLLADEYHIPCQIKRTAMGGTDAGALHLAGCGVPTAVLAVPCRYIHSPASVMHKNDFFAMDSLAEVFLRNEAKGKL